MHPEEHQGDGLKACACIPRFLPPAPLSGQRESSLVWKCAVRRCLLPQLLPSPISSVSFKNGTCWSSNWRPGPLVCSTVKTPQTAGLKQLTFIFPSSGGQNSEIRVQHDLALVGEISSWLDTFSHGAFKWQRKTHTGLSFSSHKDANPSVESHPYAIHEVHTVTYRYTGA